MDIEILETISEGRLFRILKARQGTKFIILKATVKLDSMSIELLRREYELGSSLSHRSLVTTLDFVEDTPSGPAIILEYIEGKTMDEFLADNPDISQRQSVLDDLLDAVDYLHHRGVLHNDIKPSNIIINPHGAARLIDFGLSISDDSVYTGCVGGSCGYTAPEILQCKGSSGAASDIYSIGLIMQQVSKERRLNRVISKCIAINPSERYQSISALKHAISLRRHFPILLATTVFTFITIFLTIAPRVGNAIVESEHDDLKEHLSAEMQIFYAPALKRMMDTHSQMEAAAAKGEYLMQYVHFHDSLPQSQRLVCEEIFAAQTSVLDSIYLSRL